MKAMILAAGRGKRMQPLTNHCPKPLLSIGKDSLISRNIKKLAQSGFKEIIINYAWLGEKIVESLKDGSEFGVKITYSPELKQSLETAAGIAKALPLIGKNPFLVINGDIFTNMDFKTTKQYYNILNDKHLAHLWLTKNPVHNAKGDFSIDKNSNLILPEKISYTFTGIAVYHPLFFKNVTTDKPYKLINQLLIGIKNKSITAQILNDLWIDVGTPEVLNKIKQMNI